MSHPENKKPSRSKVFFDKKEHDRKKKKNRPGKSVGRTPEGYRLFLQQAGNQNVARFFEAVQVQAKLAVSQPGDALEREADRVADMVSNATSSSAVDEKIRQVFAAAHATRGAAIPSVSTSNAIAGLTGGRPLSSSDRHYYEKRMGADFSGVRVHTGPTADELARAINARAFTYNNNVVFAKGEYAPSTIQGRHLMAHELTHVMQQGESATVVQRDINPRTNFDQIFLVTDPARFKATVVGYLPQNTGIKVIDFGLNQPFNAGLTDKSLEWWQVEITSCADRGMVGKSGWVMKRFISTTPPLHESDFVDKNAWAAYHAHVYKRNPDYERITTRVNSSVKMLDIPAPSTVWAGLTWPSIQSKAIELIISPQKINQANQSLCGQASTLNIMADFQPESFAGLVIEVFRDGKVHGREVKKTLLNQPSSVVSSSNNAPCEWMLLSAIRDVSKGRGYSGDPDSIWEGLTGLTAPWEIKDTIRTLLGNHVAIKSIGSYSIAEPTEAEINGVNSVLNAHPDTSAAIILIESDLVKKPEGTFSVPNHWVRVMAPITISGSGDNKSISFSLFSWGKIYPVTCSLRRFKRDVRHLFVISNIGVSSH